MAKRISLKDIAQRVGVSTALVSYVLNNQKQGRISKEISEKIKAVAAELNYRPNQIAKSLKTSKSYTLGLVVADIANPFFSSIARYIENVADQHNYTVLFGSSDENPQKSQKLIQTLITRQVDGLIIASAEGSEKQILELQQQEVPIVLLDRYFPGLSVNYVAIDNYKAAHQAINHLIQKGRKRLGLITYQTELFHLQERKRGYLAALKEAGIKTSKKWIKEIREENWKEEVKKAINDLLALPEPVDGLLFCTNLLSIHGLKHLNSLSIRVPDQLALVSFDETEAADLFYAPVTYIKQPLQEMSQLATQILLDCISKNNKMIQVNMEAELIIRQST
jgi:LacI family transcriptional regulator